MVKPPEMDKFLARRSYTRHDLAWFKCRGDGIPDEVEFETTDGAFFTTNMYESYGGLDEADWQLPFRCKVCPNGPGDDADIAACDETVDGIPYYDQPKTAKGTNTALFARRLV
tara:strand:- start:1308 stop:1646 length:339 start_codon:yes stop_codon:yes gene_type:complete